MVKHVSRFSFELAHAAIEKRVLKSVSSAGNS